ncbi:hypothetical protein GPECTOR_6g860 [Gonium pectorale]|uniref:Uncharacterized protein n=1 Tax=Gonium pectorale TaxID=33097 RepID=A0A150GW50_GONPE|nr:hypothetical protein GPECTOR_6g860 [Gonium pectorale]|eukprot:KXZ53942.1 hypothetical protein GPECTOR_6g860 [Gonium pectorale]
MGLYSASYIGIEFSRFKAPFGSLDLPLVPSPGSTMVYERCLNLRPAGVPVSVIADQARSSPRLTWAASAKQGNPGPAADTSAGAASGAPSSRCSSACSSGALTLEVEGEGPAACSSAIDPPNSS